MDYQPESEIVFKRNSQEVTLDEDEEESKATVQLPGAEVPEQIPRFPDDSNSMMQFLVNEVQALRSRNEELAERIEKQGVISSILSSPPMDSVPHSELGCKQNFGPPATDNGSEEDFEDNISLASSKLVGFVPTDHGRWKYSKACEEARVNFKEELKALDIANREDNWSKFESTFRTIVELMELKEFIFDPVRPHPQSHSTLMRMFAEDDGEIYAERMIPGMYHDLFGRILHKDPALEGVEVIHEQEKRRFDSAMMLLFSILTSCTASPRLDGVLDTDRAKERKDLPVMFRSLRGHFVSLTGTNIVQKMLKVCAIARHDPTDKGSVRAIEALRESKRALSDRNLQCPELFFVAIFLASLEPESAIRQRLDVLIIDKGENVSLDEVIQIFQAWYRDQEIQLATQASFFPKGIGKPPRDPKALLLTAEQQKSFRACAKVGACYECYKVKNNMDQKWADCKLHYKKGRGSKKKDISKTNLARLPSAVQDPSPLLLNDIPSLDDDIEVFSNPNFQSEETRSMVKSQETRSMTKSQETRNKVVQEPVDFLPASELKKLYVEATNAVDGATEEFDLSPLYHHDSVEDVASFKTNSVLLIDSGAARTTVPSTHGLTKISKLRKQMNLEYADGNKGSAIKHEGSLLLNGHELRALVSPDLHDGLISTSQLDRDLNATTVQTDGKSISFIPDERQQQILHMLFEDMDPDNVLAEAELNENGLYEVKLSRDSEKVLSVSVFPRVAANSLSQAVYLLHASLGHMPKEAMIKLARSTEEENRDSELTPMVHNWPAAITSDVISHHFPSCKACYMANQKKTPFFKPASAESTPKKKSVPSSVVNVPSAPGQLGQVDLWGPYPAGRSGCTHLFTIIDGYSQYAVSIPCNNKPGEIPRLLKQALEVFLSNGVKFYMIVGDSAFNTSSCKHVLHSMYGNERGIQFSLAVPEEHETCGIIERFFSSVQRRATANLLAFLEYDPNLVEFLGIDAMVYATTCLNWTPRSKFSYRSSPSSILGLSCLDFHRTLVLPFGISAIAHQKKSRSKLHGHGTEAIFIGPSENSFHRSGRYLNLATRDVIVRRSFQVWNVKAFHEFIINDRGTPMVQFDNSVKIDDSVDPDSNDDLPPLVDDSDDDDDDVDEEEDVIEDAPIYRWTHVSPRSLPRKHRKVLQLLLKENHLELDTHGQIQSIWKVHGFARLEGSNDLYVCYYDATLPRPKDMDSFEYTALSTFHDWAVPESRSDHFSRSEGASTSEGGKSSLTPSSSVRRSRRLSMVPMKTAVLRHKRLLHVLHKHVPLRLTRRKKNGSIVLVSKARIIQRINDLTPTSMKKALLGSNADQWRAARDAEHKSLEENKTFEYVNRVDVPNDAKIIKSMYVLKVATHADGSPKKFKVRLVARGDLQDPSTYNETYASTCQRKAVMLLLSIANQQDWSISTADISTAFLYGDLEEPIYMELPDGQVVRLLKSLYGLKQAAFKFKEHLHDALVKIGFTRLETDSSVYVLCGTRKVYLASHVDDLLFLSSSIDDIKWVYGKLSESYSMTFDEIATEYLGYTITRDRSSKTLKLDQFGTVSKLLANFPPNRFGKIPATPYHRKTVGFTPEEESLLSEENKSIFQQITGSLLYLAICTRGDLLYAVHMLTRRMSNPRVLDLQRAHKALVYLMHTAHSGVTFHGDDEPVIYGWADSAFNSGEGDKKNAFGYCFQLGRKSGMFINVCRRSTLIAQSSTEAELYALAEACRELIWINSFLCELDLSIACKTIFQDNTTTINMVYQDGMSERSKHIDVKFHFVKRLIRNKTVVCPHVATNGMIADIFTKDLPDESYGRHSVSVLGAQVYGTVSTFSCLLRSARQ
jgi:hypothetical protein